MPKDKSILIKEYLIKIKSLNKEAKNCVQKITDKAGQHAMFYNTEFLGHGCQGRYVDNPNEIYESNVCYDNGIKCYANEAYFGGIIIQSK